MDDLTRTIEVLGLSTDDTAFTNLVCAMQAVGMRVRCQTAYDTYTPEEIAEHFAEINYRVETGLYQRLCGEYERRRLSPKSQDKAKLNE